MLRIDQAPQIDVHLINSGEAPGGIGETGTTAATPALGNAIYAATGVALRRMPVERHCSRRAREPPVARLGRRARRRDSSWRWLLRRTSSGPAPSPSPAAPRSPRAPTAALTRAACRRALRRPTSSAAARYLTEAADCEACHTPPGAQPLPAAARSRRPSARSTPQHHRRPRYRHRRLERCGLRAGRAPGRAPGRRAPLPGIPVRRLHLPDRRGRARDQGLSLQPAGRAERRTAGRRSPFPSTSAG